MITDENQFSRPRDSAQRKCLSFETTMTIPADASPVSVVLDPGVWLLAEFISFAQANGR